MAKILHRILHSLVPKSWGGPDGPPSPFRRWLWLMAFVLLIVVFVRLAPLSERIPLIGTQVKIMRDSGVEVGAFWWTDVPEVSEAERHFKGLNLIQERPGKSEN